MTYEIPARWYIIFVRPIGSRIWTMHARMTENKHFVPWTSSDFRAAIRESELIARNSNMSVNVIEIDHPTEIDDEQMVTFSEETFDLIVESEKQEQ